MAGCCNDHPCQDTRPLDSPAWRRALWAALAVNAGMFLAEIVAGVAAGSASLQAAKGGTAPTTPAGPSVRPGAPAGRGEGDTGQEKSKRNKPLGFALTLDPEHPYLKERGVSPELVEAFGLGYCGKGIMAGRVCIPIHNAEGATVAYAGRW